MSYAKLGLTSDVYVFRTVFGDYHCVNCKLTAKAQKLRKHTLTKFTDESESVPFSCTTTIEMLVHLMVHMNAGHKVPPNAIKKLKEESQKEYGRVAFDQTRGNAKAESKSQSASKTDMGVNPIPSNRFCGEVIPEEDVMADGVIRPSKYNEKIKAEKYDIEAIKRDPKHPDLNSKSHNKYDYEAICKGCVRSKINREHGLCLTCDGGYHHEPKKKAQLRR